MADDSASDIADRILGTLSLGIIIRQFLSGAILIISYFCFVHGPTTAVGKALGDRAGFITVVAFISGALIYSLHRAFVNPILERVRESVVLPVSRWPLIKSTIRPLYLFPPEVFAMLKRRWSNDNSKGICDHLSDWADYIHFQYTAGIAVFAGPLIAVVAQKYRTEPVQWAFPCSWDWGGISHSIASLALPAAFALLMIMGGMITDCRKLYVERALLPAERDQSHAPSPAP